MSEQKPERMGQYWAKLIRDGANDQQVCAVIAAINDVTLSRQANRAAVIVGCAQILGQNITGESDIAREIRAAIMELVDGFAMHSATLETNS